MKKVLIALFVVVIIIACIVLGGYLLLKEDINYLKEEFGEEHLMEAIQSIYKIQNGEDEFLTTNDGKYMTATLNFESKIDEHMLVEYRAKKLQDTENLMMYENVGGDVVYTVSYEQNKMYTIFTIDEKTGSGTDFELTFSKRNGSGAKKIIDADKNDDYDKRNQLFGLREKDDQSRREDTDDRADDGNDVGNSDNGCDQERIFNTVQKDRKVDQNCNDKGIEQLSAEESAKGAIGDGANVGDSFIDLITEQRFTHTHDLCITLFLGVEQIQ